MKNRKEKQSHGTRAISFRINEAQFQTFQDLLRKIPGADAGSMYREVFRRGLRDLEIFYDKHMNLTCQETAAEVEDVQ